MNRFFMLLFFALLSAVPTAEGQWVKTAYFASGPGSQFGVLSIKHHGNVLFVSDDAPAVFSSSNDGNSWTSITGNLSYPLSFGPICVTPASLYLGADELGTLSEFDNYVFASTDGGASWRNTPVPFDNLSFVNHLNWIYDLAYDGRNLFAATYGDGLFVLSSDGTTWAHPNTHAGYSWCLQQTPVGMYVGAGGYDLEFSSDHGSTWSEKNKGIKDNYIIRLGDTPQSLFAATEYFDSSNHLYRSTDQGDSWFVVQNNFISQGFATFGNSIFSVDGKNGVFLSNDEGGTWQDVRGSLPSTMVVSCINISDSFLFIGSNMGIWRRPLSDFGISSVAPQPAIVENISNYPNPFSSHTQISFTSSESGYAEISIVNALGAEVARLYSGELEPGNHCFVWKPEGLALGNYWCVVRMNGQVQTVAMTVLR